MRESERKLEGERGEGERERDVYGQGLESAKFIKMHLQKIQTWTEEPLFSPGNSHKKGIGSAVTTQRFTHTNGKNVSKYSRTLLLLATVLHFKNKKNESIAKLCKS